LYKAYLLKYLIRLAAASPEDTCNRHNVATWFIKAPSSLENGRLRRRSNFMLLLPFIWLILERFKFKDSRALQSLNSFIVPLSIFVISFNILSQSCAQQWRRHADNSTNTILDMVVYVAFLVKLVWLKYYEKCTLKIALAI